MSYFSFDLWSMMLIIMLTFAPFLGYLVTLQNTFANIERKNRRMKPWEVWMMLIPFINLFWYFALVYLLSESIKKELLMREKAYSGNPTLVAGMAAATAYVLSWIVSATLQDLVLLTGAACVIVHWVQVNEYRKQFREPFREDAQSDIFREG